MIKKKKVVKKKQAPIFSVDDTLHVVNQFDYIDWTIFDTLCLHPNQEMRDSSTLFVTPVGSMSGFAVKTESDTNMMQGGMLYAPFEFTCFSVNLTKVLENNDTNRLVRNHLFQLWVMHRLMFESSLSDLPKNLNVSIDINTQTYFTGRIIGKLFDREDTIKIRIGLNGRLKRGIC